MVDVNLASLIYFKTSTFSKMNAEWDEVYLTSTITFKTSSPSKLTEEATDLYLTGTATAANNSSVALTPIISIPINSTVSATAAVTSFFITGPNVALMHSTAKAVALTDGFNLISIFPSVVGTVYPDTISEIPGVIPFQWQYSQRVLISEFADGTESRRLSWQAPRKDVAIAYHYLTREEAQQLYDFYQSMEGPLKEFAFFFPNPQSYEREYCGTYTGQTLNINLPSSLTNTGSYRKLYNGSSEVTNYSFFYHGGPNGEDRAALLNTPNVGDKFYFSFSGRLKLRARFSDTPIQVNEIKDRFSSFSVELIGLAARFI